MNGIVVTVTTSAPHGYEPGDAVRFSKEPNRVRCRVVEAARHTMVVSKFLRPSRGYARHVRNLKQEKRQPPAG